MKVDQRVALEVASHEALVRQTYKDSVGVNTWNVGMTNATGHRVERYIGKPASLQHCMNLYAWALVMYAAAVIEMFKGRPLTQAQFAAALSFHWNTGAIKRASWVRYWLRGDDEAARKAFMNWVTPSEIAKRRAKERDLFFDGKWSNDGTMLEFTRVRPNMTPDWGSGRRINVAEELRAAFALDTQPEMDQSPEPDAVPAAPTLSPDQHEEQETENMDRIPIPTPRPDLSPVEQTNKANKGAGGAAIGSGGAGAGVIYLWSLTSSFPAVWANDPQAMIILTGFSATIFGALGAWIGAYFAPDKRFQ